MRPRGISPANPNISENPAPIKDLKPHPRVSNEFIMSPIEITRFSSQFAKEEASRMKAYMGSIVPPITQFAKSETSPTTAGGRNNMSHSSRSAPEAQVVGGKLLATCEYI